MFIELVRIEKFTPSKRLFRKTHAYMLFVIGKFFSAGTKTYLLPDPIDKGLIYKNAQFLAKPQYSENAFILSLRLFLNNS